MTIVISEKTRELMAHKQIPPQDHGENNIYERMADCAEKCEAPKRKVRVTRQPGLEPLASFLVAAFFILLSIYFVLN